MDITLETQPDCSANLKAVISAADVASSRSAIISSYASHSKLPGFRPGKAPASLISKRYASEITEDLNQQLFESACQKALEENTSLKVLYFGTPEFQANEDGSLVITSVMTIVPAFDLPEYKGIEVSVPSSDVTDADVDARINDLAKQLTDYNTTDKAAEKEDIVVIDFTSTLDGKPIAEALEKPVGFLEGREGQWMKVEEDGFIPGFAAGLEGTKAGDSKDIPVTLPDNFPFAELRNKEIVFHVTVKEVKAPVVPEINDEFAARIIPDSNVEKLKEAIRADISRCKQSEIDNMKADQITDKLAELVDFELAERLIKRETEQLLLYKKQELLYGGTSPEDIDAAESTLREEAAKDAKRHLKVYFILQDIARAESIVVTDRELTTEILQQAERNKQPFKAYVRQIRRDGTLDAIRIRLLTSKVLDSLVKNATVHVTEAEANA